MKYFKQYILIMQRNVNKQNYNNGICTTLCWEQLNTHISNLYLKMRRFVISLKEYDRSLWLGEIFPKRSLVSNQCLLSQ